MASWRAGWLQDPEQVLAKEQEGHWQRSARQEEAYHGTSWHLLSGFEIGMAWLQAWDAAVARNKNIRIKNKTYKK
jgi:hypothetical protein